MPNTPRLAIPTPAAGEAPNIPAHLLAMATVLDAAAIYSQGVLGARPVSTVGSPGIAGRFYHATDGERKLWLDTGTGWIAYQPEVSEAAVLPAAGAFDGQIIAWRPAGGPATPWFMRWSAARARWEFQGGADLELTGADQGPASIGAGWWTLGPDWTAPYAGHYRFRASATQEGAHQAYTAELLLRRSLTDDTAGTNVGDFAVTRVTAADIFQLGGTDVFADATATQRRFQLRMTAWPGTSANTVTARRIRFAAAPVYVTP